MALSFISDYVNTKYLIAEKTEYINKAVIINYFNLIFNFSFVGRNDSQLISWNIYNKIYITSGSGASSIYKCLSLKFISYVYIYFNI